MVHGKETFSKSGYWSLKLTPYSGYQFLDKILTMRLPAIETGNIAENKVEK